MMWRTLFMATALASATPAQAQLNLNHAEVSHLPNGLTLIMLEDHSFPLVSVQMLYKSGSAAETTGKTGLAHFMEHLAFRASKNFPHERATELIYDAGGEWHGYTAYDQTAYFSTMPKSGLALLVKIEADRMARTVIDPASMEAEKGAVITELYSYENDPASVLLDAVTRTAIQAHPYGSPMAGYISDVERLTAEDARAYYASHYAPGNAVLAIVGDFATSEAKTVVAQDFADVPARPVAEPHFTSEPPQRVQRRIELSGAVERQYFLLACPSPAASSPDFPAFLVLQEILSGGGGLNLHQSDWSGTQSVKGSLLFGGADDIATFFPPTHDPFLFTISGSIGRTADRGPLERDLEQRIAKLAEGQTIAPRLGAAKSAVAREIAEDVQTTEDAAHQLAFFEGVGALDVLLGMPQRVKAVTAADVQRVARTYLRTDSSTFGWMVPGTSPGARPGAGNPRPASDRAGAVPVAGSAGGPQLRHLSGGLPAIVQANPLSDRATVELLLSGPVEDGAHPPVLPGLDAVVRSGPAENVSSLVAQSIDAAGQPQKTAEKPSLDPATRLEQLIVAQARPRAPSHPKPLAVIVSGNVDPARTFEILEKDLGGTTVGKLSGTAAADSPTMPHLVRERISKPLSQGALGYVVEGPPLNSSEALAWRLLLYVLTHDYSGRLGRSAVMDNGIVYYIGSDFRTDGSRTWATISTGVDPDKADAMETELRAQVARLASEPPTPQELDAARNHFLGRDLSAAQSNEELAAKLARQFIDTGGLRSHEQLRKELENVTPANLSAAARRFGSGTIIRVDVAAH
ncbi:MAG TPA: insulinase family protein [Sphingomicrobium sp.]|jgi:zinc protease